jgi:hypothetical protein
MDVCWPNSRSGEPPLETNRLGRRTSAGLRPGLHPSLTADISTRGIACVILAGHSEWQCSFGRTTGGTASRSCQKGGRSADSLDSLIRAQVARAGSSFAPSRNNPWLSQTEGVTYQFWEVRAKTISTNVGPGRSDRACAGFGNVRPCQKLGKRVRHQARRHIGCPGSRLASTVSARG